MTQRIENIMAIISETTTADEAAKAISDAHPKLSKKASENVVKDLQDFREQKISLSELDHYLQEAGL